MLPHKIVVAPDSFKGTLSQTDICGTAKKVINHLFPDCAVDLIPLADGGEGSVDCILSACGGEKITTTVSDPYGDPTDASYAVIDTVEIYSENDTNDGSEKEKDQKGKTNEKYEKGKNGSERIAVIEVASCAGLTLCRQGLRPLTATTFGVGQLINDAVSRGYRRILLCLGGSATTDAGCGMAAALGVEFMDSDGKNFVPAGGTLLNITQIRNDRLLHKFSPQWEDRVSVTALCDTSSLICGNNGAAFVYAPQKGADEEQVRLLDRGLRHVCGLWKRDLGIDLSALPGGGAAGGVGAGVVAFLNGDLRPGIETFLSVTNFRQRISDADLVITGEGRFDSQSLTGKAVVGVARAARDSEVPCIALVGCIGNDVDRTALYRIGLSDILAVTHIPGHLPQDHETAVSEYAEALKRLLSEYFCHK